MEKWNSRTASCGNETRQPSGPKPDLAHFPCACATTASGAMSSLRIGFDALGQSVERLQDRGAGANLIRQRRYTQIDTLPGACERTGKDASRGVRHGLRAARVAPIAYTAPLFQEATAA